MFQSNASFQSKANMSPVLKKKNLQGFYVSFNNDQNYRNNTSESKVQGTRKYAAYYSFAYMK